MEKEQMALQGIVIGIYRLRRLTRQHGLRCPRALMVGHLLRDLKPASRCAGTQ